jgi:trehalose 6-phosphate synthase/phosphatase
LGGLLSHTPLGILIAKKAVEVRHLGINKGEAIRAILYDHDFDPKQDFILTVGDDRTDEDMFRVYPHVNLSIGVSEVPVGADYTMEQAALLEMLENIARSSSGWQFGLWESGEGAPD